VQLSVHALDCLVIGVGAGRIYDPPPALDFRCSLGGCVLAWTSPTARRLWQSTPELSRLPDTRPPQWFAGLTLAMVRSAWRRMSRLTSCVCVGGCFAVCRWTVR